VPDTANNAAMASAVACRRYGACAAAQMVAVDWCCMVLRLPS